MLHHLKNRPARWILCLLILALAACITTYTAKSAHANSSTQAEKISNKTTGYQRASEGLSGVDGGALLVQQHYKKKKEYEACYQDMKALPENGCQQYKAKIEAAKREANKQ